MHKDDLEMKWDETKISDNLKESAEELEIPHSLLPQQMEHWLRQQTASETEKGEQPMEENREKRDNRENPRRKKSYTRWWCTTFAAAACLALVLFAVGRNMDWNLNVHEESTFDKAGKPEREECTDADDQEEGTTYEKLYKSFEKAWDEQEKMEVGVCTDGAVDDAAKEETSSESFDTDTSGMSTFDRGGALDADGPNGEEETSEDYGKTNQQEEAVEEADIIKNDGRYLYQVVYRNENAGSYMVWIIDTENGLKEAARIEGFEQIDEIYVWKDQLVILEPNWVDYGEGDDQGSSYSKIHIYNIADRSKPELYHTFTIKGSYMDSRISDGYLYFFSSYYTSRPKGIEDLSRYVPMLDGKPMEEDRITLPEETDADSYLVMASVDMERPDKFADTKALVTSADQFYVSKKNIYVADTQQVSYQEEGKHTDSTKLFRYSYKDGRMFQDAEGTVEGTLRDDMALNEYQDHLRLVTTVEKREVRKVVDDISGDLMGYDTMNLETTNSLYVLDLDLNITGKIENLAKDERIYSARFMGDVGYFVTFRETDPLFSVDLSNPAEPKILGELKISGFSEYLHFYADNLLLGIGMEVDEETGEAEGIKLSMFDISDPTDVKEKSKMNLSKYDYSEALYQYKAVLIDPKKNLFGFSAEGYWEGDDSKYENSYLVFSYENGEFQEILKVDCQDSNWGWSVRGTYIGDRFFVTAEKGFIEEYSLTDKNKVRELSINKDH